ncbi:hypothetical protein [Nonomuraea endophytica]|uniref:hypothetical protein n=1 Tax=Nonomuraea endophytica TaxID=714136 RepID=UPI0037C6D580
MCDLNPQETQHLLSALHEIDDLTAKVAAHAADVEKTAFMDHETLAALLTSLRDRADSAREWVTAKPAQHADHHG